jgi:uridylate kinase
VAFPLKTLFARRLNFMSDSDSAGAFSPRYHRVILKLSGESLAHAGERGISMDEVTAIANQIKSAHALGCQIAVVVGGGNILRGAQFKGSSGEKIQEATAHYMGMLATVINALALQDALESIGIATRVMSAIKMDGVAEPFIRRRAIRHLEKGRIVILAAGTGAPFVTTDTCAANRGLELDADIVLKATRVDGVYSDDPEKNPHAILYRELDYDTVIEKNLKIMDSTAIAQCRTHKLPILVFNFKKEGNIVRAVSGQKVGTRISPRIHPGEQILVNAQ